MFLKETAEEFIIDKIGVPFVQRDVVRIAMFDELGQSVVPIKGQKPRVFVPVNE
jgi:hypothetical protein